jgi:hypothetical protein
MTRKPGAAVYLAPAATSSRSPPTPKSCSRHACCGQGRTSRSSSLRAARWGRWCWLPTCLHARMWWQSEMRVAAAFSTDWDASATPDAHVRAYMPCGAQPMLTGFPAWHPGCAALFALAQYCPVQRGPQKSQPLFGAAAPATASLMSSTKAVLGLTYTFPPPARLAFSHPAHPSPSPWPAMHAHH